MNGDINDSSFRGFLVCKACDLWTKFKCLVFYMPIVLTYLLMIRVLAKCMFI